MDVKTKETTFLSVLLLNNKFLWILQFLGK